MNLSSALPTFVVTLREGVEAALVVGIILAYLQKAGQTTLKHWVYGGILGGFLASLFVGFLFAGLLHHLDTASSPLAPVLKQLLQGSLGLTAIGLLSWMLLWMTQQARSLKGEIENSVHILLQNQQRVEWGVAGLVFIAVLQEGFETVLFTATQFQEGWIPLLGSGLGLVGAVGIGVLLFQFGVRINLRRFFQILGVLLLLVVGGVVISTLRHFDTAFVNLAQINTTVAHWCPVGQSSCFLGLQLWDLSTALPDRQFPGILLKSFLGYTEKLYLVQAIAYFAFMGTVGGLYLSSVIGPGKLFRRT